MRERERERERGKERKSERENPRMNVAMTSMHKDNWPKRPIKATIIN